MRVTGWHPSIARGAGARARSLSAACGLFAILLCSAVSGAEDYPQRPVKIITGGSVGGPVDIASRAIANKLSESWGQSVIVENRLGANELIATETVARAKPDGYTLLVSANPFTHNPSLFSKLSYDVDRVFIAVTQLAQAAMAVVCASRSKLDSIATLVSEARAHPDKLSWASAGIGTNNHIAGEQFASAAHIQMLHVPFKGSQGAVTGVLAGEVDFGVVALSSVLPLAKAGSVRTLAVMTERRSLLAPDLPTLAEQGLPGIDAAVPAGLHVPAGTPEVIVAKLNRDFNHALQDPVLRERLLSLGLEPLGTTPQEFAARIRRTAAAVQQTVRENRIRLD